MTRRSSSSRKSRKTVDDHSLADVTLLHEAALPLVEGPEHQVVFLAVETDGQVIPVRLEVEQDDGALGRSDREEGPGEAERDEETAKGAHTAGHTLMVVAHWLQGGK